MASALLPASANAALRVFACETTWAAIAEEIGGDHVSVFSATTAHQDVHTIQARPSLIAKLRRANLLICSGSDLEIGWLPILLRRASNANVQPGTPGNIDVSKHVPMLEIPFDIDRSHGDVHPYGNPHTQTDPHTIERIASVVAKRLKVLDPENATHYQEHLSDFEVRWRSAIENWETRAKSLQGMQVITHHKSWIYLATWLDLDIVGHLEDKPGIPPTASHLSALLTKLKEREVRAIIRAAYQPGRPSRWLSEKAGIPALVLPHAVGGTETSRDLFGLYDTIIDRLLAVAK